MLILGCAAETVTGSLKLSEAFRSGFPGALSIPSSERLSVLQDFAWRP